MLHMSSHTNSFTCTRWNSEVMIAVRGGILNWLRTLSTLLTSEAITNFRLESPYKPILMGTAWCVELVVWHSKTSNKSWLQSSSSSMHSLKSPAYNQSIISSSSFWPSDISKHLLGFAGEYARSSSCSIFFTRAMRTAKAASLVTPIVL